MATKEECYQCANYNDSLCTQQNAEQSYNYVPCQFFKLRQAKKERVKLDLTPSQSKKQRMFSKAFSFEGRINRAEYAISALIFVLVCHLGEKIFEESIIYWVVDLITLYFFAAQSAKRCHDCNYSGWFQLIPLWWIVILFYEGDEHGNKYGPAIKK
ncbi:MAG: DUF805 domain-containing protein [Bacteroidales bacterium]|nr:DUF805 domain-containing protein [Bacteroidales bacterium]